MYLRTRVCLSLMLAVGVMSLVMSPLVGRSKAMAESDDLWSWVNRVFAYEAPRRARYPSLARSPAGELVVLFTHVTEEQEAAGRGDIMMIRSADEGEGWSAPTKIYQAEVGEPRTMGTLTTLASGKLVAALAEMGSEGEAELVRLLTSEDGGQSWAASAPLELPDVQSACPYGRLIERPDGSLLMPVFGVSSAGGQAGVQCVGLMRSTDGGQSWGDFSVIAADPEESFTQPAVLATGEDALVALVNSGESLYRCESEDGGYQWSSPEQVFIGREPHLVRITDQALACVYARGSGWGHVLVSFSYDNAKSWRCERKVMEHIDRNNTGQHYGWPAALALDAERLLIAVGRTQLHIPEMQGPASRPISPEEERIEVVFFERDREAANIPLAEQITPPAERGRWEQTGPQLDIPQLTGLSGTPDGELIGISGIQSWHQVSEGYTPHIQIGGPGGPEELWWSSEGGRTWQHQPMNLPPGFRGDPNSVIQLSSGRVLGVIQDWFLYETNDVDHKPTGEQRGGYRWGVWNPDRKMVIKNRIYVIYSDDEGQTWQGTEQPMDSSPLDWSNPCGFKELADGTIVLVGFGCLSEQDTRERLDVCGVFRSTDGGESWGDFSQIAYDKEHRRTRYNEVGIALVSDQLWVAFFRTEYSDIGNESAWMSRAISTDGGYTWSQPELCFASGSPEVAILPDGGIAVQSTSGLHFTYDLGRTWTRVAPCGGYPRRVGLLDNDTLLSGAGGLWQRIPPGPGGAE